MHPIAAVALLLGNIEVVARDYRFTMPETFRPASVRLLPVPLSNTPPGVTRTIAERWVGFDLAPGDDLLLCGAHVHQGMN
jgi:hypothetical protein